MEMGRVCATHRALLYVDEVYLDAAHVNLGSRFWTGATSADHVVAVNSLNKVFGLGGLRGGWLMANEEIAQRARGIVNMWNADNSAPSEALGILAFARIGGLGGRCRRFYDHTNRDRLCFVIGLRMSRRYVATRAAGRSSSAFGCPSIYRLWTETIDWLRPMIPRLSRARSLASTITFV